MTFVTDKENLMQAVSYVNRDQIFLKSLGASLASTLISVSLVGILEKWAILVLINALASALYLTIAKKGQDASFYMAPVVCLSIAAVLFRGEREANILVILCTAGIVVFGFRKWFNEYKEQRNRAYLDTAMMCFMFSIAHAL